MNSYKASHIIGFVVVVTLGIALDHDSYHALLAVGSGMLAYFMTMCLIRHGKGKQILFFAFMTIAFAQTSVTVKRAIMEEGFKKTLADNPLGVIVGDVVYGVQHVVMVIGDAWNGVYEAIQLSDYTTIEQMNYRFFTVFVMLLLLVPRIGFKKDPGQQEYA
ncbi:hypothetical protein HOA55_04610 [archaeon]|jgi:hypothetical protein|nr:hypothetical protein [archaeon]MBT6820611.1 hypothetical protein [archaeon]MBT7024979.1 hypothetical protein [archaeon]MBT7238598.1 hypothetical protein [archaeon]MBT7912418.1 hypothetical protein [Candidatus Bathyarchaeota archaeon]